MDVAEQCYREAVGLNPLHYSARLSLAGLVREPGKLTESMQEVRILMSTIISSEGYALTLMKAYEEAARCQLELCKNPTYVATLTQLTPEAALKEDAEIMLFNTLEHSADVSLIFKAEFDRHRQQQRRDAAARLDLACVDQQAGRRKTRLGLY